jgi:5-methylcytosine-specific restriction enzyme A
MNQPITITLRLAAHEALGLAEMCKRFCYEDAVRFANPQDGGRERDTILEGPRHCNVPCAKPALRRERRRYPMEHRREFSKEVRRAAFARCGGACEKCTAPLAGGGINYDHVVPWELSRDSSLGNAQVLCKTCHGLKTHQIDLPTIAKAGRQHDRAIGAAGPGLGRWRMPCGRRSPWRKKMNGKVERRAGV